ncbi:hypothetical protein KI387_014324, partial [Taxus chinensis]
LQEHKEESKKEYTVLEDIMDNKVSKGPVWVHHVLAQPDEVPTHQEPQTPE